MTRRLSIALVAVVLLLVFVVAIPVSAAPYVTRTMINQGATIFIGEQGLNVSAAQMGDATIGNGYTDTNYAPISNTDGAAGTIGWWASAASLSTSSPTVTRSLVGRNNSFTVDSADFVGYTGNWYIVNTSSQRANLPAIFNIADPTLDVQVWDFCLAADVTGKSVPQGEFLGFKINTNQYMALASNRFTNGTTSIVNDNPANGGQPGTGYQFNPKLFTHLGNNFTLSFPSSSLTFLGTSVICSNPS